MTKRRRSSAFDGMPVPASAPMATPLPEGMTLELFRMLQVSRPILPRNPAVWDRTVQKFRAPWHVEQDSALTGPAAPPISNTGALTPGEGDSGKKGRIPVRAVPDWLQGRFPGDVDVEQVLQMFSRDRNGRKLAFSKTKDQKSGCTHYIREGVRVFEGPENVFVTVGGKGCRQLEGEGVVLNWQRFAQNLKEFDFRADRIDIAFDDRSGILPFDDIVRRVRYAEMNAFFPERRENFEFVCRANRFHYESSGGYDRPFGQTLYIGERTSDTFLRFYDKYAQMMGKGDDSAEAEEARLSDTWIRGELEFKGERAPAALNALADYGPGYFAGVLRSHIEFIDRSTATRKERCKVEPWWVEFCDEAEKCRLEVVPTVKTVTDKAKWCKKAVQKTLAALAVSPGYGLDYILGMVMDGMELIAKDNMFTRMLDAHARAYTAGKLDVSPADARFAYWQEVSKDGLPESKDFLEYLESRPVREHDSLIEGAIMMQNDAEFDERRAEEWDSSGMQDQVNAHIAMWWENQEQLRAAELVAA